jgi:nitroreductase
MDVKHAISARKSIRRYVNKQIPEEVMEDLLDAMRHAPSANNKQSWSMVVVTDDAVKKKLVPVSGNQKFVGECSAYLVGVTEPGAFYSTVDMTIALDHLTLRAVELGLGTCWIGDFEAEKIKQILGIPKEREVPICMTLGYPDQSHGARKRKKLPELFQTDKWNSPWH